MKGIQDYITELNNRGFILNSQERQDFIDRMGHIKKYLEFGNEAGHISFLEQQRENKKKGIITSHLIYRTVPFKEEYISESVYKLVTTTPQGFFSFLKKQPFEEEILYFKKLRKEKSNETLAERIKETFPFEPTWEKLQGKEDGEIFFDLLFEYVSRVGYWNNLMNLGSSYFRVKRRDSFEKHLNEGLVRKVVSDLDNIYANNIMNTVKKPFKIILKLDEIKSDVYQRLREKYSSK